MNKYKTSEFAKLVNTTERTIRYYDKIGLLKPSFVMDNGYRVYTDKDLLRMQKIISLKHLGFSIDEIFPLVSTEDNVKDSFELQLNLLNSRISHLEIIRDTIEKILAGNNSGKMDWNLITKLIQLENNESSIVEQYKNSNNLNIRIQLHDKFSVNKEGWFPWLFKHIDFKGVTRLLEVGCGNGKLWESNRINLRNREIFLSDISKGMVEDVRKKLGRDFNCICFDCQKIPFKDDYFDALIANHVLFYMNDISKALSEICRVLKQSGTFYCSTYGKNHMKEINEIVSKFDSSIKLSQNNLYDSFGLENGEEILNDHFSDVELIMYEDALKITESKPLVDYIMSCHGNQNEIIGPKIREFKMYIENIINKKKCIYITKQAGIFICKKKL